jgi:hypothetical protein
VVKTTGDGLLVEFEKGPRDRPFANWVYRNLVPTYALLGREAEARAGLSGLL